MKSTKRLTTEEFISKSKRIHGDKYDYSQVTYINNSTPVKIIYGGVAYEQLPQNHLKGFKCENNKKMTEDDFIRKSKEIHGDIFDYTILDFSNVRNKVKLIYNGVIYEQLGYAHLQGKLPRGIQSESKGVVKISEILSDKNIKYIREYKFEDCRNINYLRFDFYLTDYNILIEYDGRQHFESIDLWGGDSEFEKRKINDGIKNDYCKKNGIPLLRISHLEDVDSKLIKFIKNMNYI